MQNSSIQTSNLITWIISLIALGVASLSLYLQRRDKKPRLRVSLERAFVEIPHTTEYGTSMYQPMPGFTIHARNPTEKTIKVDSIYFLGRKNHRYHLPKEWGLFTEIPSHEKRTLRISIKNFNEWAKTMDITHPEKGCFAICDALDNEYKTWKIGDSLSLEPVKKI